MTQCDWSVRESESEMEAREIDMERLRETQRDWEKLRATKRSILLKRACNLPKISISFIDVKFRAGTLFSAWTPE